MPFVYKKSRNPNGGRELVELTLKDSTAFTIGDAVRLVSGKIELVGAGNPVFGILTAIVKADGSPVTDNGAGGDFTDTYTTPASNTVKGVVDTSTESLYSVTADATLGTTTGSNLPGYNLDVPAASDTLDEDTAATTTAQFFSHGLDPQNSARVLVTIQESQVKL